MCLKPACIGPQRESPLPPPRACSRRSDSRVWTKTKNKTGESREGKRVLSLSPQFPLAFPLVFPAYDFTRSPTSECRWKGYWMRKGFTLPVRFSSETSHVRSRVSSHAPHFWKERVTKHLRWCHTGRFATKIFSATQRWNNVGTMLQRFVELKIVRGYTVCLIQSKTHASAMTVL